MAHGDHQDDDDDFMDAPQQNRPTGRAKDGEEVTSHPHVFFNVTLSFQSLFRTKFFMTLNMATNDPFSVMQKKKRHRNRASQERLTILTKGFTDE